jgi:hypothetical protein
MKRLLFVITLALGVGAAAMVRGVIRQGASVSVAKGADEATDGAFRDGLYQGELAATRGSVPHISSGRWATDKDRASFAFGYEHGYTEFLSIRSTRAHATNGAFQDGLFLGALAAKRGTEPHISAARWAADQDRASFREGYQQGYAESSAIRASAVNGLPAIGVGAR